MLKKNKQEYAAPMVELIDARVEKGFQTSMTEPPIEGNTIQSYGMVGRETHYLPD